MAPKPYILFAGTAREALTFYAATFGGRAELHTFAEFGRTDGPAEAIAHGELVGSSVVLYAADAGRDDPSFRAEGRMFSLLGTAQPETLRTWFERLADGGAVLDDLQLRPWGAHDGQVQDRFGVRWLIGYETPPAT